MTLSVTTDQKVFSRPRNCRRLSGLLLVLWLVVQWSLAAQDILVSDFESGTYGVWGTTGTAFGSAPAAGSLPGQGAVTGYQGSRLANSFNGGDASTGTLTSPSFTVQRSYIRFLIGGGNQRGKTCMNLIVNGQIVRSAVGMGDREDLGWLQWNVSELIGSNATIQIVDDSTGGWGHINVDHILQSNTSLGSVLTLNNRYLNLPVKTGHTSRRFELVVDGLVTHEFFIELADTVTPDFYSFIDLNDFQGKQALVRVADVPASAAQLNALVLSNDIVGANTIYQEAHRPLFHYTARRGWLNDPCGLVYHNGEYHLGYQHNPYGWNWGNMHWGHAVSTNLVHWRELPEWIYPDPLGAAWNGSTVVDWNNSAGFGVNELVTIYTGAAKGSDANLPRIANAGQFTQCLIHSSDSGRTWLKHANNPVLPNVAGDNRDPKVFWYSPGNKWVMFLWLDGNDFAFFSSADFKNWSQTSTFNFPGVIEVPDIFELPLDGNNSNKKWILLAGAGKYYIGTFDGNAFTVQSGPFTLRAGGSSSGDVSFAATQTFNAAPASTRRILIVHGTAQFPGMPFNNQINFPMELTLRTSPSGARVYANPVPELAQLRVSTNTWPSQSLTSGNNIMSGATGEAFELDARFQPGTASGITFNLRGTTVTYNRVAQTVSCLGITQSLVPSNGVVRLQMLVDRGIIEIFGNDGLLYIPVRVTPTSGAQPVGMVANGSGATLNSLAMHNLASFWGAFATNSLAIAAQPVSVTNDPGSIAVFSVTASGSEPLSYRWRFNGNPLSPATNILSATNSTLVIDPVHPTNAGVYDVIITNNSGAVTSSAVTLTVRASHIVSRWSMEGQVQTPNTLGASVFNGVLDARTAVGQGTVAVGGIVPAARDDLITFSGIAGNPVVLSNSVPPGSLFANGNSPGTRSFDASAYSGSDGALFFPQDQYGNELSFAGPFSIELFFKTHGDKSAAGKMQLVMQGETNLRYGIVVNESVNGSVRFMLTNSAGDGAVASLTNVNYADGAWHYLLASYEPGAGTNGRMRLTIVNTNGSESTASTDWPGNFDALPAGNDGNLFLGRFKYPIAQEHRTFLGLIDEVQITSGIVSNEWRLGKIPSVDEPSFIQITSITSTGTNVNLSWSGSSNRTYTVEWVAQLGDAWASIGTLTGTNALMSFTDANGSRLGQPTGFYRVVIQ